jgi:hypothetical protein
VSDLKRLKVMLDDEVMFEVDVIEATVNMNRNLEQIRSNPALFAAIAGAPMEHVNELPGEQVAWASYGSDIEITYKLRFTGEGYLGEFQPAMGG